MTSEEFHTRIAQLAPGDQPGLDALAQEVIDDARAAPDTAVKIWKEAGPFAPQAKLVLAGLEDVSLIPLSSKADPAAVSEVIWALRTEGLRIAELDRKIVKYFEAHLADKRKMPPRRDLGPTEEKPPVVRVCDEAYLQMRRLLNLEESTDQYLQNSRAYLSLTEAQKDDEIQNARKSRAWARLAAR
ncbi:MAG TPA: hypothetical protein VMU80_18405 [Bryobacteraceae bacterium]|nr:hypothetical protein [Bryobacteraceae bacterium]